MDFFGEVGKISQNPLSHPDSARTGFGSGKIDTPIEKIAKKHFKPLESPRVGYICLIYIFTKIKWPGRVRKPQKYFFSKKIDGPMHFPTDHAPGTLIWEVGGFCSKLHEKNPSDRISLRRPQILFLAASIRILTR
jgi:hypothetical protein